MLFQTALKILTDSFARNCIKMSIPATYQYPYCEFSFVEWNPVQKKTYPHFTTDCNLVCSASVASGKSAIAEAIFGYELSKSAFSKVIYVSPLKAIGQEKFAEWSKHDTFSVFDKVLVSSDTHVTEDEFSRARMIVSTIESINIHCRKKSSWINDVAALVFDEAHLIDDKSRGAGAEAMIMGISELCPKCRLICLSGTMSNYIEIAKWLKNCNGKETNYVYSNWRPNRIVSRVEITESVEEQKKIIASICKKASMEKTLVFVHSKFIGEQIVRHLQSNGVRTAFYHAGLRAKMRDTLLNEFRSNYSDLDVLVATSSLSMGVTI